MFKDFAILFPTFAAGAVILTHVADSFRGYGNSRDLPTSLAFLAFLLVLIYRWRADKQRASERSRVIELGHDPATFDAGGAPARAIVTVGAGVPLGACSIAWLTSTTTSAYGSAAWFTAASVSVTALVCGTILASRLPASAFLPPKLSNDFHTPKPAFQDPDVLDVAGRRG